jgi:16S rRNA (guanine527-N7)-methyltransferase
MNLTGARTIPVLIEEHIADALPLAPLLVPGTTALDVGSGAGFPALVVAVLRPDVSFFLLEKNHKKAVFLRTMARELSLSKVKALDGDIDAPPAEMPRAFGAVMSRAVFAPGEWVARGASWVEPRGTLYALLADAPTPETPGGFAAPALHEYKLGNGAARSIAAYRRASSSTEEGD